MLEFKKLHIFENIYTKLFKISIVQNMKFPKFRRSTIVEKIIKYAIELYGPRFVFTEFDSFFAQRRKCACSTCTNDKATRSFVCNQHRDIYYTYKEKSDILTDPEKRKLFFEAKAHYDSVNAKRTQNQAEAEKKDIEHGRSNECKIETCNKKRIPSKKLCSSHNNSEQNYKKNPSEKNKKYLDEYRAYLDQKEEAKAGIRAAGPVCSECGEADENKFTKKPSTVTGYKKLCRKCDCAQYNVCHKHSEPGKTCYKSRCVYCKLDDGKQPSELCFDNEFCITIIHRPAHAIYGLSCLECFKRKSPDHPQVRYLRDKEQIFHAFLKSILPNTEIKHDVPVHVTLPNGKKTVRRPDFRIETEQVIFDIEFDEHQHEAINYDTPCEQMRSDLIFEAMESSGKKYVLLRFNPDAFTAKNGDKFRACFTQKAGAKANISDKAQWDLRSSHFKSRLDEWMMADPENVDIFNVEYLFYDGFDTSNLDLASGGGSSSALKRKRKRIT